SAAYAELAAQTRPAAARTNSCIRFMLYSIKCAWMSRGGYYQDPIQPACGARYAVALRVVSDSPNAGDLSQDVSLRRRAGASDGDRMAATSACIRVSAERRGRRETGGTPHTLGSLAGADRAAFAVAYRGDARVTGRASRPLRGTACRSSRH